MSASALSNQNATIKTPSAPPADFKAWWSSYRSDMSMQAKISPFVCGWWHDLRPSLRTFLATEAGIAAPEKATSTRWDAIDSADQTRILGAARLMVSELKPASWL